MAGIQIVVNFGTLEAALSKMHDIADTKRTAMQARLKNFHRLGYPLDLPTAKGKASLYTPGHIVEMALAMEMTQLGLPPERVVRVLTSNRFPTTIAIRMAAEALCQNPKGFVDIVADRRGETDPLAMFLYFDPTSLRSLTLDNPELTPDIDQADSTFFYGGQGVVAENLVQWTIGVINRMSLINLTALIDRIASVVWPGEAIDTYTDEYLAFRERFFSELRDWANEKHEETYEHDADYFLAKMLDHSYASPENLEGALDKVIKRLVDETGMKVQTIEKALIRVTRDAKRKGQSPPRSRVGN